MKTIDRDIHGLPAAIRFQFLDLLGIAQKTTGIPKPGPNVVEHLLDKDRKGLEKRTKMLSELYGSEGNVATAANASYELTTGRRPYHSLKFHNSAIMVVKCLGAKETKTRGIFNLRWGIPSDKERQFEKDKYVKVGGKTYIVGGYTFSTKERPVGENILLELETFNLTFDEKDETYEISAWAPRFLGVTDLNVDTINSVIDKAISNKVFQGKVINPDGEIEYYKAADYMDKYEEFAEADDESKINKLIAQIAKLKEKAATYQQKDEDKDRRKLISDQLEVLEERLIKLLKDKNLKSTKIEDTTVSIRKIPDFFEITSQTKAAASLKKAGLGRFLREEMIIDLDGLKDYLNKEGSKDIKLDGINRIGNRSAIYIYKKRYDKNSDIDLDDLSFQSFYEIPYDPSDLENEVLMDDYRLVLAHWATFCMTDGEGIKFSKKQIMDVALKVIREIKQRILANKMKYHFYLNKMPDLTKSLYLKIRYQLPDELKKVGEVP